MRTPAAVIGLTGGIGSGKSTVASLFGELGVRIVDADVIAHRLLTQPPVKRDLVRRFGTGILRGGSIDRPALARLVFTDPAALRRLNRLIHPLIRREIRARLSRGRGMAVIDAALLLETGTDALCDVLIHVDVPRPVRMRRVAARGWDAAELRRRERAQWPLSRKRARADFIIRNVRRLDDTRKQVTHIVRSLQEVP